MCLFRNSFRISTTCQNRLRDSTAVQLSVTRRKYCSRAAMMVHPTPSPSLIWSMPPRNNPLRNRSEMHRLMMVLCGILALMVSN